MHQEFFSTSIEHILAELERIDLLIKLHVLQAQRMYQNKAEFQGLFISEQEIDRLLKQPFGHQLWAKNTKSSSLEKIHTVLSQMTESIAKRKHESSKQGVSLRLEELTRLFNLTPFDVDILLICLAPELDWKYERLFSYLQDDITRKKPSVYIVLNLLSSSFEDKLDLRKHFDPEAPLIKHSIISLSDHSQQQNSPLLNKFLKLDDRLINYLLGENRIDGRLRSFAQLKEPDIQLEDLVLSPEIVSGIHILTTGKYTITEAPIFYFRGPYGVGKQSAAEAACHELGGRLIVITGNCLFEKDGLSFKEKLTLILREAKLQNSAIYWNGFDTLIAGDKWAPLNLMLDALEEYRGLVFLSGNISWEPRDAFYERTFVPIVFSLPSFGERLQLWQRSLNGNSPIQSDIDLYALSNKFLLSGGQINDIIATARSAMLIKGSENKSLNLKSLYSACRKHSNQSLTELSKKIEPKFSWKDIVLSRDKMNQLKEIIGHVNHRQHVYNDWGFKNKISLGTGVTALFAGPSGTGKTMAAGIMAREIGLDLYKIDLSLVVSKYIGETEKNLSKIFAEAETSNAILFFDEADALFGKRSEVRDSHDRYANIEIAYLLQKMDEYEGISILATNLRQNMDDSFVRRMQFIVEFPFPDEHLRLQIWKVHFPKDAPVDDDIDYKFLANQLNLTGGSIKNIVLNAAFLAASCESKISMGHIFHSAKRELQKAGILCAKSDFGKYSQLLEEEFTDG
jgi:SpoVK/Ycf46/Vps4 family AAA+-type ATPase